VELSGIWRATEADDDLRRGAIGLDTDDSAWEAIAVPGHWRNHPKFASSDGPLLYRQRFAAPGPEPGRRRWVTLDGIFYQADVFLDGAYLGDAEGYFIPHTFDITALSRFGDEHVLAVEMACTPQRGPRNKRNITGVFQHWDGIDRNWNPGGLWRPVRMYDTGPVRVDRFRVLCRDADSTRAHVLFYARLDCDDRRRVRVRTLVDGRPIAESEQSLAGGHNDVSWNLDIENPALWWPRSLGDQPLTVMSIEIVVDGELSDRRKRRTGLREVAWNNWVCSVNGERLFLKGANLLPTRAGLADATPAAMRRDVQLAADAGLDVLRVHGHIAPRPLYDAADELGMLLMQDFPLLWGYARSVRSQAVDQARAAVDQLGHHPAIVSWTAHNDPAAVAIGIEGDTPRSRLRYLTAHQLPSWNKTILDRWVKRSFEKADPTRPCIPHSGVLPHLPQLDGTDSHFYFGWYHGDVRDLDRLASQIPRLFRFLSEFGAQAVPDTADFIDPAQWPDLDWDMLAERHGLQKWVFDVRVPPDQFATFDEWRHATQVYQAELLRHHIELIRRLKYRPAGGFALFSFNDPGPVVSFSVLDHERVPKLALRTVTRACAPVVVIADRPPDFVAPGDDLDLDVHVVNDLRHDVDPAVVDVVATWAGGERRWRFGGAVPADECVKVGAISLSIPETLGALTLELTLTAGDIRAKNRYSTAVTVR
jgi:beta-mannosidase